MKRLFRRTQPNFNSRLRNHTKGSLIKMRGYTVQSLM